MRPDLEIVQSMESYQCWLVVSGLNTAFVRNVARMTLGEGEEPGLSEGIGPLPGRPFTLADIDPSRRSSVRPMFVSLYRLSFCSFGSYLFNLFLLSFFLPSSFDQFIQVLIVFLTIFLLFSFNCLFYLCFFFTFFLFSPFSFSTFFHCFLFHFIFSRS